MNQALYLGANGVKSLSLNNPHLWEHVLGFEDVGGSKVDVETAYTAVGWVHRGVHIRSATLSSMPWGIYSGDDELVASDYDDFTGYEWAESLPTMLYLTEAAMCMLGYAFWFKNRTRGARMESLKWWAAHTVEVIYDSAAPDGIRAFRRKVGNTAQIIDRDNVVYFRLPNPTHETVPGTSPVAAALADAGVLYNVAKFASAFFERGAIKATILTIEGTAQQAERERLKNWWQSFMTGIRNSWGSSVVNAAVKPVVVGEGIGELSNVALTDEKRQSISTTLGIPHSLMMSNAANFATAQQDELNFLNTTIIPSARLMASALNVQLFRPLGLRFQWKIQEMTQFQEDEEQRSTALMHYVQAGFPLHIAAEILGVALPEGMEYADLGAMMAEQQAQRDAMAQALAQRTPAQPDQDNDDRMTDNQRIEARSFRKWLRRNPSKDIDEFVANHLTIAQKTMIADEVSADADFFTVTVPDVWTGPAIPDPADSIAAWKAVLQLDPDDDEAEQKAREAIEATATDEIATALEKQRRALIPANSPPTSVEDVVQRVEPTSGTVRDALRRALVASSDLGVSVAVSQFETVGYGFDWTLANTAARDWANRYSGELITRINDTTRERVRQAVGQWIENGDPLPVLVRELSSTFGRERAALIAATEVTNAYAEANRLSYIESGVVEEIEWRTAVDERVCPLCGPLHGTRTSARNPDFGGAGIPSRHPRCRCWIVPVIEEPDAFVPMPESAMDLADVGQAEQWLKRKYPDIEFDFTEAHINNIRPIASEFDKLAREWPEVTEQLQYVGTYKGSNAPAGVGFDEMEAWAHASTDRKRIGLNPTFFGKENFADEVREAWREKWIDGDGSIEGLMTHEFGHQVDNFLKRADNMLMGGARSADRDGFGIVNETLRTWRSQHKATQELSIYATANREENFAEAFAAIYRKPRNEWPKYVEDFDQLLTEIENVVVYDSHSDIPRIGFANEDPASLARLSQLAQRLGIRR